MASSGKRSSFGSVLRRKNRPGYYVRVRYKGQEIIRAAGTDRRTADEYLAQLLRATVREDLLGEKQIASMTFQEFGPILLQSLKARHAPTTIACETGRIRHVSDWFGTRALKDITVADVLDFLENLRNARQFGPCGVNRYASFLSVAFKLAVQRGYARTNPVKEIPRTREPVRPVAFVSGADVTKLVAAAKDPRFGAMLRVLADTGLRRSEALALEWRDVDLKRGCLVVRKSKSRRPRQVELTAEVHAAFTKLFKERAPTPIKGPELVWPEWASKRATSVSSRFTRLANRLGMTGMRLHDLRHGFCSRLAQAGVPLPTIAALAGHTSYVTTQRYASHLPGGATRRAIDAMQENEALTGAEKQPAG